MMSRSKDHSAVRKRKSSLRRLSRLISFAMVISAVAQELAKPAEERTWQGRVWRVVPYDFRPPTWARLRDSLWAPDKPQIFTPRVFGVGWAVNFGRLYALLTSIIRPDAAAK
jgi:hypothetical protein